MIVPEFQMAPGEAPDLREGIAEHDMFERPHQQARYEIEWVAGEEANPQLAKQAQQIHGRCYVEYGYFNQTALEPDGSLRPEFDGTREKSIDGVAINYLVAHRKMDPTAGATLRLIDVAPDETIKNLPTYTYFKDTFPPQAKAELQGLTQQYGQDCIREIAALAVTDNRNNAGSYELMRAITQNALVKRADYDRHEFFVASLTKKSLHPVLDFAGPKVAHILSEPVAIFKDDPHIKKEITVTPVLFDPCEVLDGTINAIESAVETRDIQQLTQKFIFLTDGLMDSQMTVRSAQFRQYLKDKL